MGKSVSVTLGKGSLRHNNRQFITKNVDPALTSQNVIFVQTNLKTAYENIFGEALTAYNEKQKRNDRKIPSYLEKIRKSKNGEKLFHELVVQIGDRETTGIHSTDAATAKELLTEYYHDFVKRNPNMKVFNAVLHMDEFQGTPHLHIDFIPITTKRKTGLQIQNSMKMALEEQGFSFSPISVPSANESHTYQPIPRFGGGQWLESERTQLGQLLERHGISWDKQNVQRQHLSIPAYKACAEIVQNQIKNTSLENVKTRNANKLMKLAGVSTEEVLVSRTELQTILETNRKLHVDSEIKNNLITEMNAESKREKIHMAQERKAASLREDNMRRQYSVDKIEKYDTLKSMYGNLLVSENRLSLDVWRLERENNIISKNIEHTIKEKTAPILAENQRLQEECNSLKKEYSKLNQIIRSLHEKIENLCREASEIMRAVFLFKYRFRNKKPNPYLCNLSPQQEKLIDVLEEKAHRAMQNAECTTYEKDLDGMGLSADIAKQMKPKEANRDFSR